MLMSEITHWQVPQYLPPLISKLNLGRSPVSLGLWIGKQCKSQARPQRGRKLIARIVFVLGRLRDASARSPPVWIWMKILRREIAAWILRPAAAKAHGRVGAGLDRPEKENERPPTTASSIGVETESGQASRRVPARLARVCWPFGVFR